MNSLGPDYLIPYVLIGTLAPVATILIGMRSALRLATKPTVQDRRYALRSGSALLVGWFFTALATSWFGFYQGAPSRIPTLPYGLLIPIIAGVVLFRRWPALRLIMERVPQRWIVSVQAYRLVGLIFLVLYAGGSLPGAFALPAGVGDVIVGLTVPVVAFAYARGYRGSAGWLRAWNLFGIADLIVAVGTGFLTSPSRLQILALDRPDQLISSFPLAMIPVFLVPLAALLHLASLEKLRQAGAAPRVLNRPSPIGEKSIEQCDLAHQSSRA